ncbi:unnamed protein product [Calypogeia fissa]
MAQRQPRKDKLSLVDENVEFIEPNVVVEETEKVVDIISPKSSRDEHERINRIKHGTQRLDKRSAKRVSGFPKKSGQGGKYTWIGPMDEASMDDLPVALDEKDPNYVDEDEVLEVPKIHSRAVPAKVIVV